MRAFPCTCGSCWCKNCAKYSRTHDRIHRRLDRFDWKVTRHIVLTVGRWSNPLHQYEVVMHEKLLPRLTRKIQADIGEWLWVLEFHRGGWPHWHLLIESPGGMIGKHEIQRLWGRGNCWESYIQNEQHWNAIRGYHKGKGYLAGEPKAHQLELPEYLMGRSRVRKFGGRSGRSPVDRPTDVPRGTSQKRRKSAPYRHRFAHCGEGSRIEIDGNWSFTSTDYELIRSMADRYLGDRVNGRWEGDPEDQVYALSQAKAGG